MQEDRRVDDYTPLNERDPFGYRLALTGILHLQRRSVAFSLFLCLYSAYSNISIACLQKLRSSRRSPRVEMPGNATQGAPAPPEAAAAILKPLQNKIRNLRKAIDRATPLEEAAARGETLNADQQDSVRSKPAKVLVLADLEEILKRQTIAAVELFPDAVESAEPATSKRAAKKREKQVAVASERDGAAAIVPGDEDPATSDLPKPGEAREDSKAATEFEETLRIREESRDRSSDVQRVVSLLHVVEFLKEPESRATVISYFASREPPLVSSIDADRIMYFGAMLSSPDGNVAHKRAVETSTQYCLAYLSEPKAEPFAGTSYGRLAEIVEIVGSCPLLERVVPDTIPLAFGSVTGVNGDVGGDMGGNGTRK
jgi:hypothetical protein